MNKKITAQSNSFKELINDFKILPTFATAKERNDFCNEELLKKQYKNEQKTFYMPNIENPNKWTRQEKDLVKEEIVKFSKENPALSFLQISEITNYKYSTVKYFVNQSGRK